MLCVVDSSFIASLFLPDEASEKCAALLTPIATQGAATPALWQLEVANLLLMAVRRKRITPAQQKQLLDAIDALALTIHPVLSPAQRTEVMHLADRHSLTAYDAAYLELALRLNLPLATLDAALIAAAKSEGVATLP